MNTLLIVFGILAVLWIFGKIIWGVQDQKELDINPNHPSKLSSSQFPIGSGTCSARNSDRHIWDYGHYDEEIGPTKRTCKHCGKYESRMLTTGTWEAF